MSKVIKKSNYRVVVEPRTHVFGIALNEETVIKDCKEMVEQIKRHVDNVDRVYMDCDTDVICSYCGFEWEVSQDDSDPDFPKGTPLCCQKAIDEFNEQKATQ